MHPTSLTIPTPCHENWEAMTPREQGRHCASCKITVVDLADCSHNEAKQRLADVERRRNHGEHVCVRGERDTTGRIRLPGPRRYLLTSGLAAMLCAVTASDLAAAPPHCGPASATSAPSATTPVVAPRLYPAAPGSIGPRMNERNSATTPVVAPPIHPQANGAPRMTETDLRPNPQADSAREKARATITRSGYLTIVDPADGTDLVQVFAHQTNAFFVSVPAFANQHLPSSATLNRAQLDQVTHALRQAGHRESGVVLLSADDQTVRSVTIEIAKFITVQMQKSATTAADNPSPAALRARDETALKRQSLAQLDAEQRAVIDDPRHPRQRIGLKLGDRRLVVIHWPSSASRAGLQPGLVIGESGIFAMIDPDSTLREGTLDAETFAKVQALLPASTPIDPTQPRAGGASTIRLNQSVDAELSKALADILTMHATRSVPPDTPLQP